MECAERQLSAALRTSWQWQARWDNQLQNHNSVTTLRLIQALVRRIKKRTEGSYSARVNTYVHYDTLCLLKTISTQGSAWDTHMGWGSHDSKATSTVCGSVGRFLDLLSIQGLNGKLAGLPSTLRNLISCVSIASKQAKHARITWAEAQDSKKAWCGSWKMYSCTSFSQIFFD